MLVLIAASLLLFRSTQEEADTRLILHAYHAGRSGCPTIVISSDDTDVFILCLAFKNSIPSTIYMKCGTKARTRYVDIAQVVQCHGPELCRCLPGLHAFTGCDSVSAFCGKGKLAALKLAKQHSEFRELFQALGTEWDVTEEQFSRLQKFTCSMYCSNPGTNDVNDLRYRLFCSKKGEIDSSQLPPCVDTLRKHCNRANYQTAIWCRSLQCSPEVPSPVGHGWSLEGDELTIDWMCGEPAPKAVLELLSCHCKKNCQLPTCICLSNGLQCTDLCKFQECTNRRKESMEVIGDDDDDDDDIA